MQLLTDTIDQLTGWWETLHPSWKASFYYNYLADARPHQLDEELWNCRMIGGGGGGVIEGIVVADSFAEAARSNLGNVLLHTLTTPSLLGITGHRVLSRPGQGVTYRITASFCPPDTSGLRGLTHARQLSLCATGQEDADKQPHIHATDLLHLQHLEELYLHVQHAYALQDILLLNLPRLRSIHFMASADDLSYYQLTEEEHLIKSFREKTRVALDISGY